jgi:FAD synthase
MRCDGYLMVMSHGVYQVNGHVVKQTITGVMDVNINHRIKSNSKLPQENGH